MGGTPAKQPCDYCLDVLSAEPVRQMVNALVTHVSQVRTLLLSRRAPRPCVSPRASGCGELSVSVPRPPVPFFRLSPPLVL
jgi:hypothetical protein